MTPTKTNRRARGIPKALAVLCLIAGPLAAASPAQNGRAAREPYVFVTYLPASLLGEGAANIFYAYEKLFQILEKKKNVRIGINVVSRPSLATEKLKSGAAQLAYLSPLQYIQAIAAGLPLEPLAAFQWDSGPNSRSCIYIRKNTPDQTIAEALLEIKAFAFPDLENWYLLNRIFEENNVLPEARLMDFFPPEAWKKELVREDSVYHLLLKRVDGFTMEESYLPFVLPKEGSARSLRSLVCTRSAWPTFVVVAAKNVPQADRARLKALLLAMHKDRDFEEFRRFFDRAPGGRFVPATDAAYDPWRSLAKEAEEKGWAKDYDSIKRAD